VTKRVPRRGANLVERFGHERVAAVAPPERVARRGVGGLFAGGVGQAPGELPGPLDRARQPSEQVGGLQGFASGVGEARERVEIAHQIRQPVAFGDQRELGLSVAVVAQEVAPGGEQIALERFGLDAVTLERLGRAPGAHGAPLGLGLAQRLDARRQLVDERVSKG
jgi:hypothetical protein